MNILENKKYSLRLIESDKLLNGLKIVNPDCQRLLDNDQVNKILEYQINYYKKYNEFFFSNPITLSKLNNEYYIIDGQHRLSCIDKLYKLKYPVFKIFLVILYVDTIEELDEKYIAINQNKPIELPNNINDWKNFSKYIEKYIKEKYNIYN